MIWTLVAVVALGATTDPRIEIVNAQLTGDHRVTLSLADELLAGETDTAKAMGIDYLRGVLLERLGRHREADRAFVLAMSENPRLAPYGRYRLALNQSRSGHPEVAAGLLATLLASNPPASLVEKTGRLLAETLSRGGDCRLLSKMSSWPVRGEVRRLLEISAADCTESAGSEDEQMARLLRLLEETIVDEPARLAAERLHERFASRLRSSRHLVLVGQAFHHLRRFDLAIDYLARGLASSSPTDGANELLDARYALARSHFWQADYLSAVAEFGRVAQAARRREEAAGALYQQGRSYELRGSLEAAANSFRQAYLENVDGRWAAAALLSVMRLEWMTGKHEQALATFEVLGSRRAWTEIHGRAALFLAASDLVVDRSDRAASWLGQVSRTRGSLAQPALYWRARLEELEQRPNRAVELYLEIVSNDPYHPWSQLAWTRLTDDALAPSARALANRLSASADTSSIYRRWLLLRNDPTAGEAFDRALERFRRGRAAGSFLSLDFIAPDSWPLWQLPLRDPEELLLAVGLWHEALPATLRHFPTSNVSLAYTGSRLLARDGEHYRALRHAETLYDGARSVLPPSFVPVPLRRAVFPLPFGREISEASAKHGVDPYLLTAVIREESRFNANAVSQASARGLTQFVLPTAQRLAPAIGRAAISAEDLHQPEVAIALGAAYLRELFQRFERQELASIAAYNAGESQAELWQGYCSSDEPAEFLTKVGFPETREYLHKVLSSRAHYRDLYPVGTYSTP